MKLSVARQTYNKMVAAEVAYTRKPALMNFIREQLKLKHFNDAYVRACAEDVLHDGIMLLLSVQYDCANADEAITEAMLRAVQAAVREQSVRREVSETINYNDSKEGMREISRIDLNTRSESVEDLVFQKEDVCTLEEAVERAESVRYAYGFDILLTLLLRAGTAKKLWGDAEANGLLLAFESAVPASDYIGNTIIAQVVAAAAKAGTDELIMTMHRNLSRCDVLLTALGYKAA